MKRFMLLIVEDDEDEQNFMKKGFEESGLFDIAAMLFNGKQLFSWLKQHEQQLPDIILSDINLPGMNGYEIAGALKSSAQYSIVPLVITSTADSTATAAKCTAAGADSFLAKPGNLSAYRVFAGKLYQLILDNWFIPALNQTRTHNRGGWVR